MPRAYARGMGMQTLTVLGSTGSIGTQALDLVAHHPDKYEIFALTGHHKVEILAGQCRRFRPKIAVVADHDTARELKTLLGQSPVEIRSGQRALEEVAAENSIDTVVAGIVGAAGLAPVLAAARAGKRILLANKEPLVMTGALLLDVARQHGAKLLPTDSEHNAIFQCLPPDGDTSGVTRIILTASGGPFRQFTTEQMANVTPQQACTHPTWSMGRKISTDSATLMNKTLEVIEAHYLFGIAPKHIEVLIHPQSIIHSLVEYKDGSQLAQLGTPDMRTPIANALAWPERIEAGVKKLDLAHIGQLTFEKPDLRKFPALTLGYEALKQGGTAPAIMNAANEVAVEAFLAGGLRFTEIAATVTEVMNSLNVVPAHDLATVLAADMQAREMAAGFIKTLA